MEEEDRGQSLVRDDFFYFFSFLPGVSMPIGVPFFFYPRETDALFFFYFAFPPWGVFTWWEFFMYHMSMYIMGLYP